MRNVILIITLIGFLFGQANLSELTKLPALVSHFLVHQDENPDLGFLDFVHEHYCHEHFHCTEHQNDQSLPFQSCDFHITHLSPPQQNTIAVSWLIFEHAVLHVDHYQMPSLKLPALDIWQPPKIG